MRTTLAAVLLLSLFPAAPASAEESPRLIYSSVLNCIDFYTQTAAFRFTGSDKERMLRGVSFPDALRKDQKAFKSVLKGKDGTVIQEYKWKLVTDQRLLPVGIGKAPELKTAGEYSLEYLLNDKVLAKVPLVVETGDGGTYLDGPFGEWGYVFFKEGSPESPLLFHTWFRSKDAKGKKAVVKVEILKGKKAVASTSRDLTFNSQWGERSVNFDQGRFKAKDLKDGAYQIRVTVDGAVYGSYRLTVKGGKIKPIDAQDPEKTPEVSALMEGGGERWYLKREK
jgi:hypothetical protein